MKHWQSWLAVTVLAVIAFTLIRLGLHAFNLDILFHEQIPVHTSGRSLVVLAVVAPFGMVLLASLLTSAIARSATAVAYAGSWIVYVSLLSQALLSMSGAFLLIFPLMFPVERITYSLGLHPAHKGYLPIQYTAAHEPIVTGLISVGFALIVVGLVRVVRARHRGRLDTDGLYATIRHPQHLGIILWTGGFALWGSSVVDLVIWFIVSYVFVCLGMHEEGKLIESFGSEYEYYQERVRFMPPFIPVKGPVLAHGGTGKEIGMMAAALVVGIAIILLVFYLVAVPY